MLEIRTKRMILLKYLKILIDTNLKMILLNHQNKYIKNSSMIIKSVFITKFLHISARSFFCYFFRIY